jgi:hypothetical protein
MNVAALWQGKHISHYCSSPLVAAVVVVFNTVQFEPPEDYLDHGVPVTFLRQASTAQACLLLYEDTVTVT